ncbi:YkvI family membrane protein [Corynebacterium aurimucosum]
MSYKNVVGIALSFIGLLVGAGFATGQEVVQYFTSFGISGMWGILVAGLVMTLAGTVFLQLGSYFHASEHNQVFRNITHPIISRILDVAVILTLFAVGFVMLAGAGSNMQQQFGWPAWVGSLLMLVLVLITGMFDVDKVSQVIGLLTPTIIIAVLFVGAYTLLHMPDNVDAAIAASEAIESPIPHWLISALNYNGLALILAVSMSLVIGGDNISPREAGVGGIVGGAVYAVLMAIAGFSLLMNAENVGDSDIPMLTLVDNIHPTLGVIMAIIIYLMIFNTAIGMFYALGKRLSSGKESKYRIIFIAGCLAGFAVSFAGFKALMQYVYPVLGYMGIVLVAILVIGWLRSLGKIKDEGLRRERIRALLHLKLHPDSEYDAARYDDEIGQQIADSNMDDEALFEDLISDVVDELDSDDNLDFDKEKWEENRNDHSYYTERDSVEQDRSDEEIKAWIEETGAVGDPAEDDDLPEDSQKN